MPLPDPSLEPAIRDPKKLRNTALVLVAIIFLGGWLVLKAYGRWSIQQAPDDRPAIIYRITPERDLRMLRQDGKIVDVVNLRGKVIALNVTSLRDPQAAELSMAVMKRLAQSRAETQDFHLITLVVDPLPSEKLLASRRAWLHAFVQRDERLSSSCPWHGGRCARPRTERRVDS